MLPRSLEGGRRLRAAALYTAGATKNFTECDKSLTIDPVGRQASAYVMAALGQLRPVSVESGHWLS